MVLKALAFAGVSPFRLPGSGVTGGGPELMQAQGFSAVPRSCCVGGMGEEAVWKWRGCSWSLAGPVCPGDAGLSPWRGWAGSGCAGWPGQADSSAGRFAVGSSVQQVGASQFTREPLREELSFLQLSAASFQN